MPKKVKRDMCLQSAIGKELYGNFVKERIQSSKYSIWFPIKKKRKLLTWKSTEKTLRVVAKDKMVELKEDRSLFARMMRSARRPLRLTSRKLCGSMNSQ